MAAIRSDQRDYRPSLNRLSKNGITRIMHAALGLSTEAAEVLDIAKKHVYYGKALEIDHIREEVGDLLWYVAILCDEAGFSIDQAMESNIEKLRKRYPEHYSDKAALAREDECNDQPN